MWQVIGQNRAVSLLRRSLERQSLAHAYLLVGPPHVGKMTLAVNLAQALNCQAAAPPCGECAACRKIAAGSHADVQLIGLAQNGEARTRAEIGIDQVRQMQHSASLPPFEGACKVFIIDGAESLSNEAANCLLKTLEEPVGRVVFILLSTSQELMPATVVSRCQRLELRPVAAAEIETVLGSRGVEPVKARLLARICRGGLGWALESAASDARLQQRADKLDRLVEINGADADARFAYAGQLAAQFSQDRAVAYEVLELWQEYWRDLLLVKTGCPEAVANVDRMEALAETARGYSLTQIKQFIDAIQAAGAHLKLNANARLALEVLMLDMPQKEVVKTR